MSEQPMPESGEPANGGAISPDAAAGGSDSIPDQAPEPSASPKPNAGAKPTNAPKPSAIPKPSAVVKPGVVARPGSGPRPTTGTAAGQPAVVAPANEAQLMAEAAAFGRVDEDGTVWVLEAAGPRKVGQYTGADHQEAVALYVRRFLELQAQVQLFASRLPHLGPKDIDQTLTSLEAALHEPTAVGDLDALRRELEELTRRAAARREEVAAQREAEKAQALDERTALVERAEEIAATDPQRIHWRSTGEELRDLLQRWKQAQRNGPRIEKASEDALWKRFSRARTRFERQRGQFFAQLEARQEEAKATKEQLIAEAEKLSSSTDWGQTSAAYRDLMERWKAAGRANRKDDDALWQRFRAARQTFFDARSAKNSEIDAEYAANLTVKLQLLEQAEALLPISDVQRAKQQLRPIQDRWEEAGKVPRSEMKRVESRMRAVEQAIRDAEQKRWQRSDPEKEARAAGAAAQLEEAITKLEADHTAAKERGDEKAAQQAEEALAARRGWLDGVRRATEGGHKS